MQHFLNLDKCDCGAYRYLAVREHKRSYEVYLIHHSHTSSSQDQRKYAKLASIPKFRLNIHNERINDLTQERKVKLSFEQLAVLKSLLRELESEPEELMNVADQTIVTEIPTRIITLRQKLGPDT
jgi:hypothetical protein